MANVIDVVRYFLCLNQQLAENIQVDTEENVPEIAKPITHLKMQKLLYYAQGIHLSYFNKKLFEDEILAYKHGPVVETVYQALKDYKREEALKPEGKLAFNKLKLEHRLKRNEKDTIMLVLKRYGQYTPEELENNTHKEDPWFEVYQSNHNHPISQERIQNFFNQEHEKALGKIIWESIQHQGIFE